jgi:hypothetical protein
MDRLQPDDLDASARALLGQSGFFSTEAWWRTVWRAGVPPGGTALFGRVGHGEATILLPLLRDASGRLAALTTPYTCLYQPMAGPRADLVQAGRALGRAARFGPGLRLDAMDPDWPGLGALLVGARATAVVPLRFDHFGNWHEDVTGLDWPRYLARRPGALREVIRRRLRDADRNAALAFSLVSGTTEVAAGIAAYEAVYARSWKEPEPFPDFNAELMRQTAGGALRLGLLHLGGVPIAAQMWVVQDGVAAVLKLAHDEAHKALSPGTVLTSRMVMHLLGSGGIAALDFGRGDDAYKRLWAGSRRQRIGIMLASPWHPAGATLIARHLAGKLRRSLSQPRGAAGA